MDIWLVTIGEPLPLEPGVRKYRTGMLADQLVERGHTVRWWVSAFEHQRKVMQFDNDQEVTLSDGLTLQVLQGCGYRNNISLARYVDHRLIARKFRLQALKLEAPDAIIASMPCYHLAYEAVCYARAKEIPILVDVRDLWPDIFLSRLNSRFLKILGTFVLSADFARLRTLLKKADGLVAVSKGYLQWALEKGGRPAHQWDRVFFLGYKAPQRSLAPVRDTNLPDWLKRRENQKLLIFIGTFGVSYELKLLLQVAQRMQAAGRTDICLVLAGTGEQADEINKEACRLSNVVLPGWVGTEEIAMLLANGYVGLVPCRSTKNTVPNKPFEYLSNGLPLISSLEGEMADMVKCHGIGFNYLPGDLKGLCHAIETLLDNPSLREEMSGKALAFFKEYGDADKIYKDYAEHIENLVKARWIRVHNT